MAKKRRPSKSDDQFIYYDEDEEKARKSDENIWDSREGKEESWW